MRSNSNNILISIRMQTDREGLGMVLGPLELAIMRMLWSEPDPCTNKEIQYSLDRDGTELTIPTVGTTMQRLAAKGLVVETTHMFGKRKSFLYTAAITEEELETKVIDHILSKLWSAWPDAMEVAMEPSHAA